MAAAGTALVDAGSARVDVELDSVTGPMRASGPARFTPFAADLTVALGTRGAQVRVLDDRAWVRFGGSDRWQPLSTGLVPVGAVGGMLHAAPACATSSPRRGPPTSTASPRRPTPGPWTSPPHGPVPRTRRSGPVSTNSPGWSRRPRGSPPGSAPPTLPPPTADGCSGCVWSRRPRPPGRRPPVPPSRARSRSRSRDPGLPVEITAP
ncbi:hypothetical protein [Pseudonocardia sp. ICBG601]|uniref:hypothetical protein n=1 Tax=Pseudonocardia sp. ICBG601 TaxID=2846759 RepID=UPI001CF68674|nr:hypothetical protein [Pseudonocardia sp. ICBG601]